MELASLLSLTATMISEFLCFLQHSIFSASRYYFLQIFCLEEFLVCVRRMFGNDRAFFPSLYSGCDELCGIKIYVCSVMPVWVVFVHIRFFFVLTFWEMYTIC
jgi:hypothetical protein